MHINFVAAVWGERHTNLFVDYCLPSLNTEGNFIELDASISFTLTIYTRETDQRVIERSKAFQAISCLIKVIFRDINLNQFDSKFYGSHSVIWSHAITEVQNKNDALIFIIPDLIYSIGTIRHWVSKLIDGKNAIYSPGPQVILETAKRELDQININDSIKLSVNEISELILNHLHPIHTGLLKLNNSRVWFPEYDIECEENTGLLLRELSANPFVIRPKMFVKLQNFNPCDHLDDIYFDQIRVASIEPLLKRSEWLFYPPEHTADTDIQISHFLAFDSPFSPPACQADARHVRSLKFNEGDDFKIETFEVSQKNLKKLEFNRAVIEIIRLARSHGATEFSRILSLLLFNDQLGSIDLNNRVFVISDELINLERVEKFYALTQSKKWTSYFINFVLKKYNIKASGGLSKQRLSKKEEFIKLSTFGTLNVFLVKPRLQINVDSTINNPARIKRRYLLELFLYIPIMNSIIVEFYHRQWLYKIKAIAPRINKSIRKKRKNLRNTIQKNFKPIVNSIKSNLRNRLIPNGSLISREKYLKNAYTNYFFLKAFNNALRQLDFLRSSLFQNDNCPRALSVLKEMSDLNKIDQIDVDNYLELLIEKADRKFCYIFKFEMANLSFERQNYSSALKLYTEILEDRHLSSQHYIRSYCLRNIGLISVKNDKFNDAEKYIRQSLELNASQFDIRVMLANIYLARKDYKSAALEYSKSVGLYNYHYYRKVENEDDLLRNFINFKASLDEYVGRLA